MSRSAGINFGVPNSEYRLRIDPVTGEALSCYNQDTDTEYIGGGGDSDLALRKTTFKLTNKLPSDTVTIANFLRVAFGYCQIIDNIIRADLTENGYTVNFEGNVEPIAPNETVEFEMYTIARPDVPRLNVGVVVAVSLEFFNIKTAENLTAMSGEGSDGFIVPNTAADSMLELELVRIPS